MIKPVNTVNVNVLDRCELSKLGSIIWKCEDKKVLWDPGQGARLTI